MSLSLTLARVSAPHGVHGEMRIRVDTDIPENLEAGRRVYLGGCGEPREIESLHLDGKPRIKLRGIDTREDAQALRGAELVIPIHEAVPLPKGRFYAAELLGVHVVDTRGDNLGTIRDVLVTGSNDVYVVSGPGGEILVPATREVVQDFNPTTRQMTIYMLEGMR